MKKIIIIAASILITSCIKKVESSKYICTNTTITYSSRDNDNLFDNPTNTSTIENEYNIEDDNISLLTTTFSDCLNTSDTITTTYEVVSGTVTSTIVVFSDWNKID